MYMSYRFPLFIEYGVSKFHEAVDHPLPLLHVFGPFGQIIWEVVDATFDQTIWYGRLSFAWSVNHELGAALAEKTRGNSLNKWLQPNIT